ncbi:MAG: hypothetical protein QOJ91_745 [Sphingomonadales bacterium]|nr:hypothetical protein [Sphingomonadales bacterium]
MNLDQSEASPTQIEPVRSQAGSREPWTRPFVSQLRAGSAENIPGSAFQDGPLETIGS